MRNLSLMQVGLPALADPFDSSEPALSPQPEACPEQHRREPRPEGLAKGRRSDRAGWGRSRQRTAYTWSPSIGGDGIPFNATPGTGSITSADEWVEFLNVSNRAFDLTGWQLVMIDTTPVAETVGAGTAVLRFSHGVSLSHFQPGERLIIGNPAGAMNPVLRSRQARPGGLSKGTMSTFNSWTSSAIWWTTWGSATTSRRMAWTGHLPRRERQRQRHQRRGHRPRGRRWEYQRRRGRLYPAARHPCPEPVEGPRSLTRCVASSMRL